MLENVIATLLFYSINYCQTAAIGNYCRRLPVNSHTGLLWCLVIPGGLYTLIRVSSLSLSLSLSIYIYIYIYIYI